MIATASYVVGDCFAARPSARTPTTAVGELRKTNSGEREFSNIPGACRLSAVIEGNTVTISGFYGLIQIDDFGYTSSAKENKKIIYYKGSKGWELLKTVAEKIGGQMTFGK